MIHMSQERVVRDMAFHHHSQVKGLPGHLQLQPEALFHHLPLCETNSPLSNLMHIQFHRQMESRPRLYPQRHQRPLPYHLRRPALYHLLLRETTDPHPLPLFLSQMLHHHHLCPSRMPLRYLSQMLLRPHLYLNRMRRPHHLCHHSITVRLHLLRLRLLGHLVVLQLLPHHHPTAIQVINLVFQLCHNLLEIEQTCYPVFSRQAVSEH